MLKITLHDSSCALRFRLEGKLAGAWVGELRQCWQTAVSTTSGRTTTLDLSEVDFVDAGGQALIAEMRQSGVRIKAASPLIQAIVAEIGREAPCDRVEEKLAQPDAIVSANKPTRNPRPV